MFVCGVSECTRTHVHERLQLSLRSLRDLDQRRVCQHILVRSVLEPHGALLKTTLDPAEQDPIQDLGQGKLRDWEENVLYLKEQLRTLRSRDAGLVSELQELDRQILALRLDPPWSHDLPPVPESPAPDSRPSSGFFDLSDEASLSNSVFSLCSALDPEATPTSPVTTTETPPSVSDLDNQAPLQRSLSAPSPHSSSGPSSSGPSSLQDSTSPSLYSPPVSHLDRYISSLLQRRTLTPTQTRVHRPVLIQTSLTHRASLCTTAPLTPPTVTATATLTSKLNRERIDNAQDEQKADILDYTENEISGFNLHKLPQDSTEFSPNVRKKGGEISLEHSVEFLKLKNSKRHLKQKKTTNITLSLTKERPQVESGFKQRSKYNHTNTRGLIAECAESNEDLKLGFKEKKEKHKGAEEQVGRRSKRNHRKHLSSTKTNARSKIWECPPKGLKRISSKMKRDERPVDLGEFEENKEKKQDGAVAQRRITGAKRTRLRSGSSEDNQDGASLRSHHVRSHHLKHWGRLSQSQSSRAVMLRDSPIREEHSEEGGTEDETGSEGEHTRRGGTRRPQLIRIKASQNLKRRILRQKTGTFTLMTTV